MPNRCTNCVSHRAPKLAIRGISEQGAERLLDYEDHPELDACWRRTSWRLQTGA
jgi:hypothetical protein